MINSGAFNWTRKCGEWKKSWGNLCYWHEHSHVKDPSDSWKWHELPWDRLEEWQDVPCVKLRGMVKPPQVEVWMLATCAESISHSFLLQDEYKLRLHPSRDSLSGLVSTPPSCSPGSNKFWVGWLLLVHLHQSTRPTRSQLFCLYTCHFIPKPCRLRQVISSVGPQLQGTHIGQARGNCRGQCKCIKKNISVSQDGENLEIRQFML